MRTEELFNELRRLNRIDKLRAMEVLVLDLAAEEETLLLTATQYEVWSPFDAPIAAEKLTKMLDDDKEAHSA